MSETLVSRTTYGSHDAATFAITPSSTYSTDAPEIVGKVRSVPIANSVLNDALAKWAKTQSLNIKQQLEFGTRYLDLRIEFSHDYKMWVVHSMKSMRLSDVFSQISRFAPKNDIVIVHIQKVFNISERAKVELDKDINVLGALSLCDNRSFEQNSPIGTSVKDGRTVFLVFPWKRDHASPFLCDACGYFDDDTIQNPWANAQTVQELLPKLVKFASERDAKKIFVLQNVVTPDSGMISDGVKGLLWLDKVKNVLSFGLSKTNYPTSIRSVVDRNRRGFIGIVNAIGQYNFTCNVVMLDFVDAYGPEMTAAINELSRKWRKRQRM